MKRKLNVVPEDIFNHELNKRCNEVQLKILEKLIGLGWTVYKFRVSSIKPENILILLTSKDCPVAFIKPDGTFERSKLGRKGIIIPAEFA